ncbi:hypothetical protein FDG2_1702 [Candidatus Protofrankia californiensis]|uniref:Uncharacterized protein n=1 Tax=Candidatus Protofrankia californiensis TaxID=1839754 RepID=A0A1C3NW82_9ACTN|nr:hypothetical protein FDG2_1702 [Candidatus Protofrankia californiensis]
MILIIETGVLNKPLRCPEKMGGRADPDPVGHHDQVWVCQETIRLLSPNSVNATSSGMFSPGSARAASIGEQRNRCARGR